MKLLHAKVKRVLGIIGCIFLGSSIVNAKENLCLGEKDTVLVNGKIVTMDPDRTLATSVRVRAERIVAFGKVALSDNCVTIIDLKGRTVIPGLIDSHLHFVRQGLTPGYDTREVEIATSKEQFLELLKKKAAKVPSGRFVTVIGGISKAQFMDNKLPDLVELDSSVSDKPVYIQFGFAGPAYTNSLGIKHFKKLGITVNKTGEFSAGAETNNAFAALESGQQFIDKVRSTKDLMIYANSVGLTMVFDEGGTGFPGASFFDTREDYRAILQLYRRKEATIRVKIQLISTAKTAEPGIFDEQISRIIPQSGDSMLKYSGTGEHIVSFPINGQVNSLYSEKIKNVADHGWSHEQHSVSYDENKQHLGMIAALHQAKSIKDLRWSLSHVFELGSPGTEALLRDIKAMNMGVRVQNQAYSSPTDIFPLGRTLKGKNWGPLYRTLYDSGIPLGAGTDGSLLGPINPWLSIYYMLTGKNIAGEIVNPDQTLSRMEALELYTIGNAWFGFDEKDFGSIEVGKFADLVVLNKDYLSVPHEEIRGINSVLTMVNGKIVYRELGLTFVKPNN